MKLSKGNEDKAFWCHVHSFYKSCIGKPCDIDYVCKRHSKTIEIVNRLFRARLHKYGYMPEGEPTLQDPARPVLPPWEGEMYTCIHQNSKNVKK
jgi:hypothetical protein